MNDLKNFQLGIFFSFIHFFFFYNSYFLVLQFKNRYIKYINIVTIGLKVRLDFIPKINERLSISMIFLQL